MADSKGVAAMKDDKVRVYCVTPHGFATFYTKSLTDVTEFLGACADGDRVTVRIEMMTKGLFNAMPEYQGP